MAYHNDFHNVLGSQKENVQFDAGDRRKAKPHARAAKPGSAAGLSVSPGARFLQDSMRPTLDHPSNDRARPLGPTTTNEGVSPVTDQISAGGRACSQPGKSGFLHSSSSGALKGGNYLHNIAYSNHFPPHSAANGPHAANS